MKTKEICFPIFLHLMHLTKQYITTPTAVKTKT
jgi:hypothetical protein